MPVDIVKLILKHMENRTVSLMKVLKDFVNYELEESEITWILVLNLVLDDYNVEGDYYSGTLVFGVRPNPTYEARQILLDNGSEDGALIIQSKKVDPGSAQRIMIMSD